MGVFRHTVFLGEVWKRLFSPSTMQCMVTPQSLFTPSNRSSYPLKSWIRPLDGQRRGWLFTIAMWLMVNFVWIWRTLNLEGTNEISFGIRDRSAVFGDFDLWMVGDLKRFGVGYLFFVWLGGIKRIELHRVLLSELWREWWWSLVSWLGVFMQISAFLPDEIVIMCLSTFFHTFYFYIVACYRVYIFWSFANTWQGTKDTQMMSLPAPLSEGLLVNWFRER